VHETTPCPRRDNAPARYSTVPHVASPCAVTTPGHSQSRDLPVASHHAMRRVVICCGFCPCTIAWLHARAVLPCDSLLYAPLPSAGMPAAIAHDASGQGPPTRTQVLQFLQVRTRGPPSELRPRPHVWGALTAGPTRPRSAPAYQALASNETLPRHKGEVSNGLHAKQQGESSTTHGAKVRYGCCHDAGVSLDRGERPAGFFHSFDVHPEDPRA
jgi:hypothetical protein